MLAAVMTMVRNEAGMLPRWLRHYGGQVGSDALFVIDDMSDDGSTEGVEATVIRLPERSTAGGRRFDQFKAQMGNLLGQTLLTAYDAVIFTDVDEFLVPDPRHFSSLPHYLDSLGDRDVVAPIGLELMHSPVSAPALRTDLSLLTQRRHVRFAPFSCKPLIKRRPFRWGPGQHGIQAPYTIDRGLFLFHAHFADLEQATGTQVLRHEEFQVSDSGRNSMWKYTPGEFRSRLTSMAHDGPEQLPVFDPATLLIEDVVHPRPKRGGFTSRGEPLRVQPMMELPGYLTDQV